MTKRKTVKKTLKQRLTAAWYEFWNKLEASNPKRVAFFAVVVVAVLWFAFGK